MCVCVCVCVCVCIVISASQSSYNPVTHPVLQYNWTANFQLLLNETASLTVDGGEPVVVVTPTYFANLSRIITSANAS